MRPCKAESQTWQVDMLGVVVESLPIVAAADLADQRFNALGNRLARDLLSKMPALIDNALARRAGQQDRRAGQDFADDDEFVEAPTRSRDVGSSPSSAASLRERHAQGATTTRTAGHDAAPLLAQGHDDVDDRLRRLRPDLRGDVRAITI